MSLGSQALQSPSRQRSADSTRAQHHDAFLLCPLHHCILIYPRVKLLSQATSKNVGERFAFSKAGLVAQKFLWRQATALWNVCVLLLRLVACPATCLSHSIQSTSRAVCGRCVYGHTASVCGRFPQTTTRFLYFNLFSTSRADADEGKAPKVSSASGSEADAISDQSASLEPAAPSAG